MREFDSAANANEQGVRGFSPIGAVVPKAHFTWKAYRKQTPFVIGAPCVTLPLPSVFVKHVFWFAFKRDDGLQVATEIKIDLEFSKNSDVTYRQPLIHHYPQVSASDQVWFEPAWVPYYDNANFIFGQPVVDCLHVQHEGFVNITDGFWIMPQYVTCAADRIDVVVRAFNGSTISFFLAVRSQTHLM